MDCSTLQCDYPYQEIHRANFYLIAKLEWEHSHVATTVRTFLHSKMITIEEFGTFHLKTIEYNKINESNQLHR